MVQVDLPGAFAAGQILAVLSKAYLKQETSLVTNRLSGPMVSYFSLIFAPAGLFLLICWPAWECMYWWEWIERPAMNPPVAFFYLGFFMTMIVIGTASYVLAHSLYRKGKDRMVTLLTILGVIATLMPFILWPFTWYHVGSWAEYNVLPRRTLTMFESPDFFYSWFSIISYFALASIAFGFWIKGFSRQLAAQHK